MAQRTICDCCGADSNTRFYKYTVPVRVVRTEKCELRMRELDICETCLRLFSDYYYERARIHHRSGVYGCIVDEEE